MSSTNGNPCRSGRAAISSSTSRGPRCLRGIYGDPERYKATYWSRFPGNYFPGDGCKRDEDGYYWLLGRVDDVMNVSGHRLSTTEIESALVAHDAVAEAAVVGQPDDVTGEAIFAFVILKASARADAGAWPGAAPASSPR